MSILLLGADGSMGRRYQAILRYLGHNALCVDKDTPQENVTRMALVASGIIIATPTDTHGDYIRRFMHLNKPILCEKPVVKNMEEMSDLFKEMERRATPFRMVLQYEMLTEARGFGPSRYNYFRHGNDGLIWDCMQIIGLAKGAVELKEDSPTWQCMINGRALNISHMDAAYIGYLQKWFKHPGQDLGRIQAIHDKTAGAEKGLILGRDNLSLYRNSGAIH